jgi:hypothetical protein
VLLFVPTVSWFTTLWFRADDSEYPFGPPILYISVKSTLFHRPGVKANSPAPAQKPGTKALGEKAKRGRLSSPGGQVTLSRGVAGPVPVDW